MSLHRDLTGANLHEPKGADSANAGEVYVADGAGSGAWSARQYTVSGVIADVSTAETVLVAVPYAGTVVRVDTVLEDAITGADATLTVRDSGDNSMGTITITQSGSATGDTDSLEPAANDTVADNDYVQVETDGGSTGTERVWFTITVERND